MTAAPTLTAELRAEVLRLEDDLRRRVAGQPDVERRWRAEHDAARAASRTAASWQAWSDERVTQAAVAWVLTTVFVRFCEDNRLVSPVWVAGASDRRGEATEAQAEYLREEARTNPDVTDRDWLLQAVQHLQSLPATRDLVDRSSAMWLVTPSGDAAARLLAFWRERDDDGNLLRDLADERLDTRFLGDLYQDISEEVKKRYALLQTPEFVEDFILDRAMEPALDDRPLEGFRMIDPTCGSGHFLLGTFHRLLDRWHKHDPGLDEQARVQKALDAVHGVDLNPYAVAIARFRLTLAALQACGLRSLEHAPAWHYHLAVGDSLLHGLDQGELNLDAEHSADRTAATFTYATENYAALRQILQNGRYDVVVGNPPYVTVKDPALNREYRRHYSKYCRGTYALTVPFMKRFFDLAASRETPGWMGQITSNSFMKRGFGAPLVEGFLPTKDLRLLADTSGAYIPGHGTPTIILVGRNTRPVSSTMRAILGVRGEPARPEHPAEGTVWTSAVRHVDEPGFSNEWINVVDLDRAILAKHPWSLSGGGAVELMKAIDWASARTLGIVAEAPIGRAVRIGADDAFVYPAGTHDERRPIAARPYLQGEDIRDWRTEPASLVIYPYSLVSGKCEGSEKLRRHLWPSRTLLANRATFQGVMADAGREWWEYMQHTASAYRTPLGINFAHVATHNHFAVGRGGVVFNRHAPVVKLPQGATEGEHLALLGVLNSSTACFWLKQNSHNRGSTVDSKGARQTQVPWEDFYEFTGTTLQDYPLPAALPLNRGRLLDRLARDLTEQTPAALMAQSIPTRDALDAADQTHDSIRAQMVAEQEELDWETYGLYGLVNDGTTGLTGAERPPLALGERAFEIVLARKVARGEEETAWFERHGSTPITELPAHWPDDYHALVERRIELIESHPYIRLLERPEYKRRWASEPWERQEERALRGWLLNRLEDRRFWFDAQERPLPRSVAHLADDVARDPDLVSVLALWEGRRDVPVATSLQRLLAGEAVPFLAAYRYKESGLRKRAAWEHTWALQRQEDAGTYNPAPVARGGDGPIPVPPKYTSADFAHKDYWSHRGKLDVPKERFVLYPDAGRETDPTPVLGWAGWDHAEQALALAILLQAREADGWPEERLVPLVAGLAELQPWLEQWHADPQPAYGGTSPAAFFAEQLDTRSRQVGCTLDELAAWRPQPARRGRALRTRKAVS
jgi:hypothetical protein